MRKSPKAGLGFIREPLSASLGTITANMAPQKPPAGVHFAAQFGKGNNHIILENKHGKKRILTRRKGTKVSDGYFTWTIPSDIEPGSMYKIYVQTLEGKMINMKSVEFNIKNKIKSHVMKNKELKTAPKWFDHLK